MTHASDRSKVLAASSEAKAKQPDGIGTEAPAEKIEKTDDTMTTNVMEAPPQGMFLSDELEHEILTIFKLLSDETRLRILLYLGREQELHVTALCTRLNQSQPAVSHHLALLREADLI